VTHVARSFFGVTNASEALRNDIRRLLKKQKTYRIPTVRERNAALVPLKTG
jgi:hypothetical protein